MTTGSKIWAAVVILGICVLAALAIVGNNKTDAARRAAVSSQRSLDIQRQSALRTECFRDIGATLDHFRWQELGELIDASVRHDVAAVTTIGDALRTMPTNVYFGEHGGTIGHDRIKPCPPAPIVKDNV